MRHESIHMVTYFSSGDEDPMKHEQHDIILKVSEEGGGFFFLSTPGIKIHVTPENLQPVSFLKPQFTMD